LKYRNIFKQVIIWLLVVLLAVVGYFIYYIAKNISFINKGTQASQVNLDLTKNVNILLLGTDARTADEGARSDTIILVNIDPKNKKINVLSIPRDTRVDIPGHGYDKINSAFNKDYFDDGGADLTIKTVESLLGLPENGIPFYAVVNFEGFEKVIDAIGGVTIDVKERMYYYSWTGDVKIDLQPGVQHLDGEKALEYARFRFDAYGDFTVDSEGNVHGRIERQQELLKAIVDQTKDLRNLWRFPQVAKAVGEAVNTNLTPSQITKLGLLLKDVGSSDVQVISFPGVPDLIDEISFVMPNYDKLKEIGSEYFSLEIK
jgi:LCP family protein required for cell wall assembly